MTNKNIDKKQNKKERGPREIKGFLRAMPIILLAIALFISLCFITAHTGAFGNFIAEALTGLFSYMGYTIPLIIAANALFFYNNVKSRKIISATVLSFIALITLSEIAYLFSIIHAEPIFDTSLFFSEGTLNRGGGLIGGLFGFILVKLMGKVGLLIIILLTISLYILYFIYGGGNGISRFLLEKIGKAANFGAMLEKRSQEKKKLKKEAKLENKRASDDKKHAEIYNDDYFHADNGVSRLEIPELGILETKNGLTDSNVLRNTVVRGNDDERKTEEPDSKNESQIKFDYSKKASDEKPKFARVEETPEGFRADDIVYEEVEHVADVSTEEIDNAEKEQNEPRRETIRDFGLDDSADAIFTADFDPFDIALNEKRATKLSSKAAEIPKNETRGFSEMITDMTPEQAEQARRLEEFEKCRREALRRKEEAEAKARIREATEQNHEEAKIEPAIPSTISEVPVAENPIQSSSNTVSAQEATEVQQPTASNQASQTSYANQSNTSPYKNVKDVADFNTDYELQYGNATRRNASSNQYRFVKEIANEPRLPYATLENGAHESSVSGINNQINTKQTSDEYYEQRQVPADNYQNPTLPNTASVQNSAPAEPAVSEIISSHNDYSNSSAEAQNIQTEASVPSPIEPTVTSEPEEFNFGVKEVKDDSSNLEVSRSMLEPTLEIAEPEEQKYGLDFSSEEVPAAKNETEDIINATVDTDKIEEPIKEKNEDELDYESELSENDLTAAAEDVIIPTVIPPEERNPKIEEYRSMFTVLDKNNSAKESEKTTSEEENSEALPQDSTEPDTAAMQLEYPDGSSENYEVENDGIYDSGADLETEEEDEIPFELPKAQVPVQVIKTEEKTKPVRPDYSNYKFPPYDLLRKVENEDTETINDEIQHGADQLLNTLESFNIKATMRGMERGPRITRYSIVPAKGIRVNQIEKLSDDIALAMAAESIRIEAPIPGKSAVGVEVPNRVPSIVSLRELLESSEFINEKSKTTVCIGKSVEGMNVFGDIGTMPHLLIAGATGMGKSVCMNSLITSVLYKARPDEVKFIMIDPKKVEFAPYNGIPHLLVPVVTDPKQAAGALLWAVDEMNKRYDIIEKLCVRGIDSYNEKVSENPELGAPMPKIIILIDELNDLMIQVRDPVENLIMLIAQKARAAGIHLVIGTQRPSVNVITGVIKANIPSRIACKVSSGIDSRTILEQTGAEKLIGKGDMLFAPSGKASKRVQGAFVSEAETAAIVDFVKSQARGELYDEQAMEDMKRAAQKCDKKNNDGDMDDDDDDNTGVGYLHDRKFLQAVELAIRNGSVATSFLQRKLHIGYGKAAQYIDIMEDLGIVGEKNGSKARDILITMSEWNEKLSRLTCDD